MTLASSAASTPSPIGQPHRLLVSGGSLPQPPPLGRQLPHSPIRSKKLRLVSVQVRQPLSSSHRPGYSFSHRPFRLSPESASAMLVARSGLTRRAADFASLRSLAADAAVRPAARRSPWLGQPVALDTHPREPAGSGAPPQRRHLTTQPAHTPRAPRCRSLRLVVAPSSLNLTAHIRCR